MDIDQSLSMADTAPSMNYKWLKDSHISHNHPTADGTTTSTTFVRGQLESARKEQIRRVAKMLDAYKSPLEHRTTQRLLGADQASLLPQAASSPKTHGAAYEAGPTDKTATPTNSTRRSMAPTPTSASQSWRKHTMRPEDPTNSSFVSPHLATTSSTPLDSSRTSVGNNRPEVSNPDQTNYRSPHVTQVEDSYWQKSLYSGLDQSDITPSPLRNPQPYFTAKQFAAAEENSLMVESLKIASPRMPTSPYVQKHGSTIQISHDAQKVPIESPREVQVSMSRESSFRPPAEKHLIDQIDEVEHSRQGSIHSELSKVDSQATSLQRAIASAINDGKPSDSREEKVNEFGALPVEDAIVARYRASRQDQSHPGLLLPKLVDTGLSSTMNLPPKEDHSQMMEPLKHASPLLGRNSAQFSQLVSFGEQDDIGMSKNDGIVTQIDIHEPSKITELMSTLEKVTNECSRRGEIIENMVEDFANRSQESNPQLQSQLQFAQQKVDALEQKMLDYQRQMAEMQQAMHSMQREAQQASEKSKARDEHERSISRRNHDMAEESFEDKISRWECTVPVRDTERPISRTTQTRPHGMTRSPAPALQPTNADDLLRQTLRTAKAELHRLDDDKDATTAPRPTDSVRPLTADRMPDANDPKIHPSRKLYTRLSLHQVDHLSRTEMGNLLKNILIQLDVPLPDLSSTIISLARHDDVVHECIKLREFAETVHASLYNCDCIEGEVTSEKCLEQMAMRVARMQRSLRKR